MFLCIDPSSNNTGLAIIDKGKVVYTDVIRPKPLKTRKEADYFIIKSQIIYNALAKLLKEYEGKLTNIIIEVPRGAQNASAAYAFGMVNGILGGLWNIINTQELEILILNNIALTKVLPKLPKNHGLTGKQRTDRKKRLTQELVQETFPNCLKINPKTNKPFGDQEHIADALAMYLYYEKFNKTN